MGAFVALAALLTAAWPASGRPVVALFAPGSTPDEIMHAIASAEGQALSLGVDRPVSVSIGNTPEHASSLYRAGAWLVADAAFAKLCFRLKSAGETDG